MKIKTEGLPTSRTPADLQDVKKTLLEPFQQLVETIGHVVKSFLFLMLLATVALPLSLLALLVPNKDENE